LAKKSKTIRPPEVNWYIMVPIIVFIAVVPLIVHMKSVPLEGASFEFWTGEQVNSDLFSYYKSLFIIICAVISTVTIGFMLRYQKLKIKRLLSYIPIGILGLCIIASAILAEYPKVAWLGFPDRYEGALVLVSYLIMCFVIINAVKTEREYRIAFLSIMASAVMIAFIAVFQFMGWDIFTSTIGQLLISPTTNDTGFSSSSVYSTLYNSNYVGSYMAMLLPLTLGFYILSSKTWVKVLTGCLCSLMFAALIVCYSRAGFVGAFVSLAIGLFIFRNVLKREWKSTLAIIISFALIFALINYFDSGRAFTSILSITSGKANNQVETREWKWLVSSIPLEFKGDGIVINNNNPLIVGRGSEDQVQFFDIDNKIVPYEREGDQIVIKDKRFKDYEIKQANNLLVVAVNGSTLYFKNINNQMIPVDHNAHPVILYKNMQGSHNDVFIRTNGQEMTIIADDIPLIIKAEGLGMNFLDQNGKPLDFIPDVKHNEYYLDDSRYTDYKFSINDNRLKVQYDTTEFDFLYLGQFFLPINEVTPSIDDIKLSEFELALFGEESELHIINDDNELVFKDENSRILPYEKYPFGNDFYVINDHRFIDYIISTHDNALQIEKGRKRIVLAVTESGYKYVNAAGNEINLVKADSFGFEGRETIGSSRGYIWSRTIPLLKDTVFMGHGPDTFPIYFPQHDVEAKFKYLDTTTTIVDKPHNLYLQMAVNTGIISLLAFLVLITGYLYSGRRYLCANFASYWEVGGSAVQLAIIGYLVAGLFNDSIVSVAPVFWGLMGLGIGLNHRNNAHGKEA
jgi:hypothetical protein